MNVNRIQLFVVLAMAIGLLCTETLAVQRGRGNQRQQGMQQQQRLQDKHQLRDGTGSPNGGAGVQQRTELKLSNQESTMLRFMREEEKLARDVYLTMNEKWGVQIFSNIARAESQHMAVMANLLSRYDIADPIENDQRGVFTIPQLQELYDSLVEAGSNSALDAIAVGLRIEEIDIADLRATIAATDRSDIQNVLRNLERASENHLRAFAKQLVRLGGTYTATRLTQEEFNAIATATGPSRGNRRNSRSDSAGRGIDNPGTSQNRGNRRGGRGR